MLTPHVTNCPFPRNPSVNDAPLATSMRAKGFRVGVTVGEYGTNVAVSEGSSAVPVAVCVAVPVYPTLTVRVGIVVYVYSF